MKKLIAKGETDNQLLAFMKSTILIIHFYINFLVNETLLKNYLRKYLIIKCFLTMPRLHFLWQDIVTLIELCEYNSSYMDITRVM